jgi:hypothetical protein
VRFQYLLEVRQQPARFDGVCARALQVRNDRHLLRDVLAAKSDMLLGLSEMARDHFPVHVAGWP